MNDETTLLRCRDCGAEMSDEDTIPLAILAAFKAGWSAGISAERWGGHDTAEAAFDDWLKRRDWKEPCLCNFNQKMVGDGCFLCSSERA